MANQVQTQTNAADAALTDKANNAGNVGVTKVADAVLKAVAGHAAVLAKADAAFEAAIPEAARQIARIMGTEPKFDFWEAVADAFRSAYKTARGCVDKTAENRWHTVTAYMADNFGLEKPKKATEASTKKAKAREEHAKKVDAAKAQCVKPAEAFQQAAKLIAEGKINEAKVFTEAGHALAKQVADDAAKQNSGKLKEIRDAVRAEVAKADADRLAAVLAYLRTGELPKAKPAKSKAPRRVKAADAA